MELFIWAALFFPGPFYSMWRRLGTDDRCPHCGIPGLVKLNSDAGWMARRTFDAELGLIVPKEEKTPDALRAFGNEKPAEMPKRNTPVDPEQW